MPDAVAAQTTVLKGRDRFAASIATTRSVIARDRQVRDLEHLVEDLGSAPSGCVFRRRCVLDGRGRRAPDRAP